ncbi:hypothetical protein BH09VER1_BH09VER1_50290 [soil metagenome]
MWFLVPALLVIHILICAVLVLVILMQLPRSEGLGAAFGGSVTENIFGAQTTHVLARFTVGLGIAFFVITLLLAVAYSHVGAGNTAEKAKLLSAPLVAPSATPAAVASPSASPALALPTAEPSVAPTAAPLASPVPAQP